MLSIQIVPISDLRLIDTCGNSPLASSRVIALASEYDLIPLMSESASNLSNKDANSDLEQNCQNSPKGIHLFTDYEIHFAKN